MNSPSPDPGPAPAPAPPPVIPSQNANNAATYVGGLIAGGIFYFLGTKGITAPAGAEATIAALFAGVIGQWVGRLKL
jgi:hypothetical protein